jgi:DNA-binding transcriptional ArsR family regulator
MTTRGERELRDLDLVFNALAHQSRRTILTVLQSHGGAMTSGAIASWFDSSWPTTTRHLRVLEDAGLVEVELRGRERVYKLEPARLHAIATTWLTRFDQDKPGTKTQDP